MLLYLQGLGAHMATGFDGKQGPQAMLSGTRVRGCLHCIHVHTVYTYTI